MGLELTSPIVAGASKLTANIDTIKQIEQAGAGAVVCASLFEEQIQLERMKLEERLSAHDDLDAEITSLFPHIEHGGPKEHLMWVRKTKEAVGIPVIASLNAVDTGTWVDYARRLEDTGVDGLELNFYYTPGNFDRAAQDIESEQVEVLHRVTAAVGVPVSVKLSHFYSNPLQVVGRMDAVGVDAFVLFNRLFESDIDIESERHTKPLNLSCAGDNKLINRFVGLLYGRVKADLAANTGILGGADVIKAILAGAGAVQVVSALYAHKVPYLATMLEQLSAWMDKKGYATLADFRGKCARVNINDPFVYRRAQYVDLILRSDELLDAPDGA
jgi:dihydroorotate dehydrogenase (fumarate)